MTRATRRHVPGTRCKRATDATAPDIAALERFRFHFHPLSNSSATGHVLGCFSSSTGLVHRQSFKRLAWSGDHPGGIISSTELLRHHLSYRRMPSRHGLSEIRGLYRHFVFFRRERRCSHLTSRVRSGTGWLHRCCSAGDRQRAAVEVLLPGDRTGLPIASVLVRRTGRLLYLRQACETPTLCRVQLVELATRSHDVESGVPAAGCRQMN